MTETTNVLAFRQPSAVDDPLTDIVRAGARDLLARAIEIEVGAFLASTANLTLPDGRARLVRHGHGPVREIATGIGPVEVARPKVRDRGASGPGDRLRFSSAILPLWARRTKSLDALIPVLYLRGISTGDFQEALSALLGKCQSAFDWDPLSASKRDPFDRRALLVALGSSELVGVAETARARVV
ncbi:hypothetical protein ACVIJW_009300 [Bradyrhizobium barranii subsp. barranii]